MNIHSHFQLQRVSLELPEIHYIEPEDKTQYDGRENEGHYLVTLFESQFFLDFSFMGTDKFPSFT